MAYHGRSKKSCLILPIVLGVVVTNKNTNSSFWIWIPGDDAGRGGWTSSVIRGTRRWWPWRTMSERASGMPLPGVRLANHHATAIGNSICPHNPCRALITWTNRPLYMFAVFNGDDGVWRLCLERTSFCPVTAETRMIGLPLLGALALHPLPRCRRAGGGRQRKPGDVAINKS
jgi:hypothetical protein